MMLSGNNISIVTKRANFEGARGKGQEARGKAPAGRPAGWTPQAPTGRIAGSRENNHTLKVHQVVIRASRGLLDNNLDNFHNAGLTSVDCRQTPATLWGQNIKVPES